MAENIYMYVFNTLSDWEPSYIVSELNSGRAFKKTAGKYNVKTFGLTKDPVTTMGGIKILPDLTIDEISAENTALLLLPGGDTWMDENNKKVLEKTREFLDRGILVAAICGATQALASAGMLNDRIHTSNGVAIVKQYPNYDGEKFYINEPAVTDKNLITAAGAAPLEFAYHVIKKLEVFTPTVLENWYGYYKTQDSKYLSAIIREFSEN
jgi:putative intracellular protease/amidase